MRIVDLGCGGGGASMGLSRLGYSVVGVDIAPQPRYPFQFIRADVLDIKPSWLSTFDAAWVSMPCQRFTNLAKAWGTENNHPDLIAPVRKLLLDAGIPFVMENVPEAPLRADLTLCGSMFGLRLIRHRIFEIHGFTVEQPEHGTHHPDYVTVTGKSGGTSYRDGTVGRGRLDDWKEAMGIDWLPEKSLKEAVPPAYSEYIFRSF